MSVAKFCEVLPKIELHAHLNGSLSDKTLEQLYKLKNSANTFDCSEFEKTIANFKIVQGGQSRSLSECFALFGIAQALTDTPDAVKLATKLTLEEFALDNVVYLELRSTPRENKNMTKFQYVQAMVDAVIECNKTLHMLTAIIVSIDRRNSMQEAMNTVDVAVQIHEKYPDIVVGLDLSGDPTKGCFREFVQSLEKGRNVGLKITVHTAEVENDEETLEILQWAPDRLGHVTCIPEDNTLWHNLLTSKIPIELCLTSNVKCGVVKLYSDHHFDRLFKANHPICLATDDKGVFTTTLSEEYKICAETFQLNEDQLLKLSLNTCDYIFNNDFVKETIRKKILQQ